MRRRALYIDQVDTATQEGRRLSESLPLWDSGRRRSAATLRLYGGEVAAGGAGDRGRLGWDDASPHGQERRNTACLSRRDAPLVFFSARWCG